MSTTRERTAGRRHAIRSHGALRAALCLALWTAGSVAAGQDADPAPDHALGPVAAFRAAREALGEPAFAGRTIDAGGNPVAGVRVALAPRDLAPRERSLHAACNAELRVVATTDADGRFRIGDPERALGVVEDGRYALELLGPGFAPLALVPPALPGAGTLDLGDLELRAGRPLAGIVRDRDGLPVRGAAIALAPVEHARSGGLATALPIATTRADGTFDAADVPPGTWTLVVAAAEHPETRFEAAVGDAAEPARVELELPRAAALDGHVLSLPDHGFDGVLVHALPLGRLPHDDAGERDVALVSGVRSVRVGDDGRFEVPGLEHGRAYALRALPAGVDPLNDDPWAGSALVRAPARGLRLELRRDAALELSVVDGRGDAVEAFAVRVHGALPELEGDPPERAGEPTVHHAGGRLRLDGLRPTGADEITLSIASPLFAPWSSEVYTLLPGGAFQVGRVMLAARPGLALRVVDADGAGVPDAVVRIAVDGPPFERFEAATGPDGRAVVPDEPRAPRHLGVVAAGFAPRLVAGPFPGHEELVVELAPEAAVAVSVVGPDGAPAVGVPVAHRAEDALDDAALAPGVATPEVARTGTDGVALFGGLAPGEHAFEVVRRGRLDAHERGAVRVGDGALEALTLTADLEARVRGVVLADGRPLPGASLVWRWSGSRAVDRTFRADDRGRFETRLERGRWLVEVRHSGRTRPVEIFVAIDDDAEDLVLDAGPRGSFFQVAHAGGAPAAGAATFVLGADEGPPQLAAGDDVFALAEAPRPDALADAHGLVHVDLSGAARLAVTDGAATAVLDLGADETPAALVLQPAASLALERERWAPPGDDRALVLLPDRGFPAVPARVVFPYRGDALLEPDLAPGAWTAWIVSLDALGRAREARPAASIDLVAGQRTLGALPR